MQRDLYCIGFFLGSFRSCYRRCQKCSIKKVFLKDFTKVTGKQVCENLYFRVAMIRLVTLLQGHVDTDVFLLILGNF